MKQKITLILLILFSLSVSSAQLGSYSFAKTVTTAGTRVALQSSEFLVRSYIVVAKHANTGLIYVGGSNVSSSIGTRYAADGGEGWSAVYGGRREDMYDLSKVYIDSSVNSEGVIVRYVR